MIHQFSELGRFFLERQGVSDPLERITQDPGAKFGPTVLLLVFGPDGFRRVQVESYDESQRSRYLYRKGPPNTWDPTPTSGMPQPKSGQGPAVFLSDLHTRIARLGNSVRDALAQSADIAEEERQPLETISAALPEKNKKDDLANAATRERVVQELLSKHPDSKQRAFLSVAWQDDPPAPLKHVGDFQAFRDQLLRLGGEGAARSQGVGQCCICGRSNVPVLGNLQVPNFKFYTLDKPGSVSGGFDEGRAWRNFPVCQECCAQVDFSGEWIKKELAFRFYGFSYLMLPTPVQPNPTEAFHFLRRLIAAKVDNTNRPKLMEAEDDLLYVVAQEENNRLQVDLLFYQPDPQSFRPALYISGLLPTRFRELFDAKNAVDAHPWLGSPGPVPFTKDRFTFGSLRHILPSKAGGSRFDDDFLAVTRAALEKRAFDPARLLAVGMRLVQQDFLDGKSGIWAFRLANLFRSLLFFEFLVPTLTSKLAHFMPLPDYGTSPQADRVRSFFSTAPNRLGTEAPSQAAFLIGACCGRIEDIQRHRPGGTTPFSGKLKAFRVNQSDVERLIGDVKDKAQAYGPSEARKVIGLTECAAAALTACPDQWPLSPDEISYYFALGHALRSRLADPNTKDEDAEVSTAVAA